MRHWLMFYDKLQDRRIFCCALKLCDIFPDQSLSASSSTDDSLLWLTISFKFFFVLWDMYQLGMQQFALGGTSAHIFGSLTANLFASHITLLSTTALLNAWCVWIFKRQYDTIRLHFLYNESNKMQPLSKMLLNVWNGMGMHLLFQH